MTRYAVTLKVYLDSAVDENLEDEFAAREFVMSHIGDGLDQLTCIGIESNLYVDSYE